MARTFHREASLIGPALVGLALLLAWLGSGCSMTRWEAEDGHSTVRHGLVIMWGTTLYIGDGGRGETTAKWSASGEKVPTTQPASLDP